jgi:hypothetical protein
MFPIGQDSRYVVVVTVPLSAPFIPADYLADSVTLGAGIIARRRIFGIVLLLLFFVAIPVLSL